MIPVYSGFGCLVFVGTLVMGHVVCETRIF